MSENIWKLQDAKARFSELVRQARKGEPQRVTVHGKEAVVVVDPARFNLVPIASVDKEETLAGFFERSRKYRARNKSEELVIPPRSEMVVSPPAFEGFDDDEQSVQ